MAVSGMLEGIRAALSLAERTQNAELLGTLNKTLADMTELISTNADLRDEVRRLKDELAAAQKQLGFAKSLTFLGNLYHAIDENGTIGEPYCPTCWESKNTPVHLHWIANSGYHCYCCKHTFQYNHRPPGQKPTEVDSSYMPPPGLAQIAIFSNPPDDHRRW
jgi:hypothetical protein